MVVVPAAAATPNSATANNIVLQRIWIPLIPQSCSSELGTLAEGGELGPDDRGCDRVVDKGEGRKAAIGTGDHPLAPYDVGILADPLGDEPGMLDEIGRRVDDPGNQDLVVRYVLFAQILPFMRVPRIGRFERQARRTCAHAEVERLSQRDVVGVR